jgi:superoxide dismutase, Cu-Zn family
MKVSTPRFTKECILAGIMLLPPACALAQQDAQTNPRPAPRAVVEIEPLGSNRVNGTMTLEQVGQSVAVVGTVNGLTPGKHGFHIHEGRSCDNRGSHFHPGNAPHGAPENPDDKRHLGDLGNVVAGQDGTAQYSGVAKNVSLTGPNAIAGRVLVVHQGEDDYVSQPGGNAGEQIGCGVIKVSGQ